MARRSVLLVVLAVVLVVVVAACGGRGGVSISVSPSEVTLAPGETQEFTATVLGGGDSEVEWSASGGDLVASGSTAVFMAPAEAGEYTVTARSARDRGRWASAAVTVAWPGGGGIASLVVGPGAVTLVALGEEAALEVRAFDVRGAPVSLGGRAVEWRMSESSAVGLVVDPDDSTRATVRASGALGSAVVSAAVLSGGEVLSNPVGVSVASVLPEVELVPDESVAFPFVDLPPGTDPATFRPPGYEVIGGVALVAGFSEDEIAALLVVEGITLLYPVIVVGEPPAVGEVLLGTGGSAVMGRVRGVESRAGAHLVQLVQVDLDEVFEDFVFSFNSVELEAQGVLTQASWRGVDPAPPVVPSGAWIPIPDCEFEGGLTAVGIEASVNSSLDPILEFDVNLRAGMMRLLVGVRGSIAGELGVDLQGGVTGTVSCNAGRLRNLTMPLPAGPLATLLSGGAQFQPKFKVAVEASAGPRFGVSGSVGFEPVLQAGFDMRDGEIDNLSGVSGEPTADFSLIADLGFGDMNFSVTPGYYFEGDVGIQLGGWTLEKICGDATSWIPKVGDICEDVKEALFLEALQGSLGVELQTVWDSPRRVLNQEESESRMLLAAVTTAALRNDALNAVLERFKFAPVELELFSHQLRGPTFYRVFRPAVMEVTAPSVTGPVFQGQVVEVELGDTLHLRVTGEREHGFLPMRDTPLHVGEVWIGAGRQVAEAVVSVTGEDSLSIDLLVSAELCEEAVGGLVPLHFLGYNRMLDLVATAGYLGHVRLNCGASEPPDVEVTIEPEAVTLAVSDSESLTAKVTGARDTSVTWDATCGSISGSGNTVTYTAPDSVGTCLVRATSLADSDSWAEATVTVEETPRPPVLASHAFVAAGYTHSLAVVEGYEVWAWGDNRYGQLGLGSSQGPDTCHEFGSPCSRVPIPVPGITDVVSVAAGWHHSLALRADGTVWGWGDNRAGQLGDGTQEQRDAPTRVPGLNGIIAIGAGGFFSFAVGSDGRVWAWGDNYHGMLGVAPDTGPHDCGRPCSTVPRLIAGLDNVVSVAGGDLHAIALDASGDVWGWGYYLAVGDGVETDQHTPVRITGVRDGTWISAILYTSIAIDVSGQVWMWGQLNCDDRNSLIPLRVADSHRFVTIGYNWSLQHCAGAAVDGSVAEWGWVGDERPEYIADPIPMLDLPPISEFSSSYIHVLAATESGSLFAWGENDFGLLGDGTTEVRLRPVPVSLPRVLVR